VVVPFGFCVLQIDRSSRVTPLPFNCRHSPLSPIPFVPILVFDPARTFFSRLRSLTVVFPCPAPVYFLTLDCLGPHIVSLF